MRFALLALCLVCAFQANAQVPKSLESLQREQEINDAMAALNAVDAQIEKMVAQRALDCKRAVGYAPFCSCVMTDMPIAWTFADYVAITTKSKKDNGYAAMDKKLQIAYDLVGPIRDRCVAKINRK